jgi:sec-independent protein translocase protein TatA
MLHAVGPTELLLILFIALLVFGKRLPETMRSLGMSMNEFKKGLNDNTPIAQPAAPPAPAPLPAPVAVTKQLP